MILTIKTNRQTELSILHPRSRKKSGQPYQRGFCFIFVPHTTAAVTINESADSSVKSDILTILNQVFPWRRDIDI
jgi:thiamine phosphate synthase YjbQ (UPF0047 family)